MENPDVIKIVAELLLQGNEIKAGTMLRKEYPFLSPAEPKRKYTVEQKMKVFVRDGFLDRYSSERLVNPGLLKVLTLFFPHDFPYHPHWKMSETHLAYWELSPTVDHIIPVACGGSDSEDNWVTTSMMHNQIKSSWTLEQLNWKLHPCGNMDEWDGLTYLFLALVRKNITLLKDQYIKTWYNASERIASNGSHPILSKDLISEL